MKTELTEYSAARGWIYYDAQCSFCRAGLKLVGRLFARRGFEWLPLQTPGAATRLRLPEEALREEMKLQLPDGRVLGGIDSWICLLRSVWWLWPWGTLLSLPGFHAASHWAYRWLARNRYCFGGKCRIETKPPQHRTIPFLDLP